MEDDDQGNTNSTINITIRFLSTVIRIIKDK